MFFERETPTGLLIGNVKPTHTFLVLETARPCSCGRMMHFAINRRGRTLCVACDVDSTTPDLVRNRIGP